MNIMNRKSGILLSFCVVLIGLFWFWPHSSSIVTFNATEVRGKFIRQLAEHRASVEQVSKRSHAFKHRLNAVLAEYARSHHVVIVDSQSVLAGSKDITADILLRLTPTEQGK